MPDQETDEQPITSAKEQVDQPMPNEEPQATDNSAAVGLPLKGVPRVVSLIVLLVVVLLIGVMFFRVMASFLVPLFLAAVLTVVFKPLHNWTLSKFEGRKQVSALATTLLIALLVVVPTAVLGWMAYVETDRIVRVAIASAEAQAEADKSSESSAKPELILPDDTKASEADAPELEEQGEQSDPASWTEALMARFAPLTDWYHENVNSEFDPSKLAEQSARYAVKVGLVGVQSLLGFLLGASIMIFALYYFFADGPSILETLMHLSPLDDDYERELLQQFASVSRAVVLATLLAAIVQGLLAAVGYYFVLEEWTPASLVAQRETLGTEVPDDLKIRPPLFLLMVLTMLLAIVPFIGATAVWVPVAFWVYFVQGDLWPAVGMAIYGFAVVSSIDNVIKPYVLHGQSNLHPLLALLSVLGGIQLLGPIGILVGPMLVAFMQALLQMLRKELDVLAGDERLDLAAVE